MKPEDKQTLGLIALGFCLCIFLQAIIHVITWLQQ